MYLDFYKLATMPFQLTPDHRFFFGSQQHSRAISHLLYGLSQEEGFIIITGEVGAGKTMLIEHIWSQLEAGKYASARILTTQLQGDDLLKMVAAGLGMSVADVDKATLLQQLERFFAAKRAEGKRCLLVIDEVQNLPFASLEELRMLSNISVSGRAPFQCLLLGQPQFRETLGSPGLEQLRQRVLAAYHLGPMSDFETRDYVIHRLKTAGWRGLPSFDDGAFAAIHAHTTGIPRRINTLCSRVLLSGFLEEAQHITERMVANVAEELIGDLNLHSPIAAHPAKHASASPDEDLRSRVDRIDGDVRRTVRTLRRTLELISDFLDGRP